MRLAILLTAIATSAHAQSPQWGQWFSGPTEFTQHQAWVTELADNAVAEFNVLCAADTAYVSIVWFQGETQQMEGPLTVTVDGQSFVLPGRYLFYDAYPGWTANAPRALTDALRAGTTATAQSPTRGPTAFRLRGSGAAISETLAGCGTGSGYNATLTNYFALLEPDETGTLRPVEDAPAPSDPPTGAIVSTEAMVARATEACMGTPEIGATAIQTADPDGDGTLDVLLNWAQIRCPDAGSATMMQGASFCGIGNCSVDLYLSSVWQPGDWPKPILNHMAIDPMLIETESTSILRTQTSGGNCAFADLCETDWQWNGRDMAPL